MLDITKILVPYDFSSFSRQALLTALEIAKQMRAEVYIVHVEVLHGAPLIALVSETERTNELQKRIENDNIEIGQTYSDVVLHYVMGRDVTPGAAVLHFAETNDIDLIVLGTHGRRGVRRIVLGSVAEEIVRHAACPVITIRGTNTSRIKLDEIKRLLVPVDFSQHSEMALAHAKEFAALSGAIIDILHVIRLPSYPTLNDTGLFSIYDYHPNIEQRALEHMQSMYEQTSGPEVNVNFHVRHGLEANEIILFAKANDSDLIVMGTHGLTGMSHFLLGSIASKTIRRAPCPMLTVKSFGKFLVNPTTSAERTEAQEKTIY